ncbi:hypothetical protein DUNSADRAFT_8304 [Dunaliella salina]|uniref:Uncharacterized protein n=1 Tax=Dunaliella salina TaxID=3046 RepID=A0ABQ7H5W2_DUNSA|nr:hypothetical protein DUNSADRAFT_8304 [Dunaliella salina]|eukprot:KAF5842241.1 hypothetical protein DUNSADRAFT_8304 [Dunaliella salina]
MKLLESWVGRGVLQVFLGLMTLELEVQGDTDWDKSLRLYKEVAGLSMTGCGLFYVLGGVTCIGCLKRSRQRRHLDRMKAERDLAALRKQEEDLKARLASYTKT